MSEIVAIVEGSTEQTFVRDQLAAHLGQWGVSIWAVLSGKTRKQGGVRKWAAARSDIVRTLKEGRYCTTMFDFYAMPQDWPGRAEAAKLRWDQRGSHVEAAIAADVAGRIGESFDKRQFIPYVQVHEFEALMFADVTKLAEVASALSGKSAAYFSSEFADVLHLAGDPEAINDHYETCPSRRITSLVRGYRKATSSPVVAQRIGLQGLRTACGHFAAWLDRLEELRPGGPEGHEPL